MGGDATTHTAVALAYISSNLTIDLARRLGRLGEIMNTDFHNVIKITEHELVVCV